MSDRYPTGPFFGNTHPYSPQPDDLLDDLFHMAPPSQSPPIQVPSPNSMPPRDAFRQYQGMHPRGPRGGTGQHTEDLSTGKSAIRALTAANESLLKRNEDNARVLHASLQDIRVVRQELEGALRKANMIENSLLSLIPKN